jgi:hypothetical protein
MVRRDKNTLPLLCNAWRELSANAPQSQEKEDAISAIQRKLDAEEYFRCDP